MDVIVVTVTESAVRCGGSMGGSSSRIRMRKDDMSSRMRKNIQDKMYRHKSRDRNNEV